MKRIVEPLNGAAPGKGVRVINRLEEEVTSVHPTTIAIDKGKAIAQEPEQEANQVTNIGSPVKVQKDNNRGPQQPGGGYREAGSRRPRAIPSYAIGNWIPPPE